jgi:anaerobic selenocysteine-containing dehydrogenase
MVKVTGKTGSITVAADVTANVKKGVVSLAFAAASVKLEKAPEDA